MTNHYIVNATTREIWAEFPVPSSTNPEENELELKSAWKAYNSRPHYPYSTELNWMDGQRVLQGTDFEIKAEEIRKVKCHCPCHKNPGMVHIQACCQNGYRESRTPAIAIPLPSNSFETWPILSATILGDKEEKTSFTLEDMLACWEAAGNKFYADEFGSVPPKAPSKEQYFKQTFNIDISNKQQPK